jgi:hypothetical protein
VAKISDHHPIAAWLTNGQKEVLMARVTTNPPSAVTAAGGTVSLMDGSTTRDTEARTAGTDRRLVREVISATDAITAIVTEAIDDRSPGVKQRRRAARWCRIAFSLRVKLQHPYP